MNEAFYLYLKNTIAPPSAAFINTELCRFFDTVFPHSHCEIYTRTAVMKTSVTCRALTQQAIQSGKYTFCAIDNIGYLSMPLFDEHSENACVLWVQNLPCTLTPEEEMLCVVELKDVLEKQLCEVFTKEKVQIPPHFISTLSYNMQMPLTVASAAVQLLQLKLEEANETLYKKEYKSKILTIRHAMQNAICGTNNFLKMQWLDAQKQIPILSPIELYGFFEDYCDFLEPLCKLRELKLETSCTLRAPMLFPCNEPILKWLFNELISNAIAHTSRGGTLSVCAEITDDAVCFIFKDTGVGISEENLPHIYEKFWQADTEPSTHPYGTGLGLYIAKKYTHLLGGTIEIISTKNVGTTVRLALPTQHVPSSQEVVQSVSRAALRHERYDAFLERMENFIMI